MLTVRTPVRSTPRAHEATSAMSAVCTCTSRVAGSEISGALSPPAGCRFSAPNLVNDSLTTTRSAPARNGSASPAVCRSPVISPTGTPQASATRALTPLSPTRTPFSSTCEITEGLYVWESTELSPDIDPW
jgi:hypothetical protein